MNLKRFIGLLLALSVCCACISVSLAEEVAPDAASDPSEPSPSSVVSSSPAPVSLALPQPLEVAVTLVEPEIDPAEVSPSPEPSPSSVVLDVEPLQDGSTEVLSSSNITRDLQTDTARPDGSVVSVLISLLGEYSPATYQTVTYMDGVTVVTTEIVPGIAGLDWPWIASAGIFALMLFCLFKLLGGLWK